MTKNKKLFFLLLFLLFIFWRTPLSAQASQYVDSKNILILNSYHAGFTWTDDQTKGILSSLASSDVSYTFSIEYLDWKRYPTIQNLEESYINLKYKYQNQKIDLILCTDDAAFSFATANRKDLFSDAPIVFSGINSEGVASLGAGVDNFTGVTEVIDPKGTMEAAISINPDIDKIYLIYDNTESGLSTGNLCIQAASEINSNIKLISLNNLTAEEVIEAVQSADKNTLILITTYAFDYDGDYINHEQFCKELGMISPVPLYHIYDFSMNSGIFGGNLTIGRLQGEVAGTIGLRILNGESASSIPIVSQNTNQYTFDYNLLEKYGLTTADLPAGSILINEPFSFVKTYKSLVITVLVCFILLIAFTLILLFYIKKISMMQAVLKVKNEELTQIYEELTASEEEIRHQYIELTNAHEQLSEYSGKLYHLAHHDSLTGLYNRLFMYEEVDKRLSTCEPECALYFIDIDNFKYINDALGHNIGDDVLQLISQRLLTLSSEQNLLIRLSGDEFVFIANHLENKEHAENLAQNILSIFSTPFHIQGNLLSITASIGIAMFPENGHNVDSLLRNADMAMYKAKNNGKNGLFFFNQLIKDEVLERINIEKYFQKALTNQEFMIHYQPQVMTESIDIDGFEALIRWNSPDLGFLSPARFIHIAEETGFIITLGEWVLRSSCQFIKTLNLRLGRQYRLSVNISVIQLFQENFVSMIKTIIKEIDFIPELLELEITESVIMESVELISEKLRDLKALGVSIALDDFGTGYSSLAYLKNIPFSTLKIDKLFIDDIIDQQADNNLTDTIIALGHKMNLTIVAEGVETLEQVEYLHFSGCDKIQGYYYSKPLPPDDLEIWIENSLRQK